MPPLPCWLMQSVFWPTRWRWGKLSRRQAVSSVSSHHTTHLPAQSVANTKPHFSPPTTQPGYSRPTRGSRLELQHSFGLHWVPMLFHFVGLGWRAEIRIISWNYMLAINKNIIRFSIRIFGGGLCYSWPNNNVSQTSCVASPCQWKIRICMFQRTVARFMRSRSFKWNRCNYFSTCLTHLLYICRLIFFVWWI